MRSIFAHITELDRHCTAAVYGGEWWLDWGDWPNRGPDRWGFHSMYYDGFWATLHMGPLVVSCRYY